MHNKNEIILSRRAAQAKNTKKVSTKRAFGIGSALGAAALSGLVLAGSMPAQATQVDESDSYLTQEALPEILDMSIFDTGLEIETESVKFERLAINIVEQAEQAAAVPQIETISVPQTETKQPNFQENTTVTSSKPQVQATNNNVSNIANIASNASCANNSCYGAQCSQSTCANGQCAQGNCVNGFCSGTNCTGNNQIQSTYASYNCDGNTCYSGSCNGGVCGYGF